MLFIFLKLNQGFVNFFREIKSGVFVAAQRSKERDDLSHVYLKYRPASTSWKVSTISIPIDNFDKICGSLRFRLLCSVKNLSYHIDETDVII